MPQPAAKRSSPLRQLITAPTAHVDHFSGRARTPKTDPPVQPTPVDGKWRDRAQAPRHVHVPDVPRPTYQMVLTVANVTIEMPFDITMERWLVNMWSIARDCKIRLDRDSATFFYECIGGDTFALEDESDFIYFNKRVKTHFVIQAENKFVIIYLLDNRVSVSWGL